VEEDLHNRGLQDEVIKSIDAWLADQCLSCDNLDASKLREYSATRGWQLQVVVLQTIVNIDLVLPEGWPYDPPDFYLADKSYYLTWPHVEENGRLCLKHGSTVEISPYRPLNVIQIFFGEMLSLLDQLTTHQLDDDFYDEFETYLALGVSANSQPIYSILSTGFETGKIAVWRRRRFSVIGENPSRLTVFSKYQQKRFWMREAGGQLFAYCSNSRIEVRIATEPRRSDRRTRFGFLPSRIEEQNEINDHFQQGLHFIGDWHTHPENIPRRSTLDGRSMRECFRESKHHLNGFLLVVVGTANFPSGLDVSLHNAMNSFDLSVE
jgi:integrative and conjugative element protein (TIGR02256 family)